MRVKHATRPFGLLVIAALLSAASVRAQVLQNGDLIVGAHGVDSSNSLYGRIFRLRGQSLTLLVESGANGIAFGGPSDIIIDAHNRIVFFSGGCGGNSNSSAILRYDPATNVLSQLLCIPYIVGPGGPPAGFPPEATQFYGPNGLHRSRSLQVVIDDDINGGLPQVSFAEAYAFSVAVYPRPTFLYGQWWNLYHAEAFRYVVDDDRVEPGISTALIPAGGNQGVEMFTDGGATYYAPSQGGTICRAGPDLSINVNAHAIVGGQSVTLQGSLRVAARNEVLYDGQVIDNTLLPNSSVTCSINNQQVTDDNVPTDGTSGFRVLAGIRSLGMLNGGLFATCDSLAAGYPWLFNIAPRDPFLNPYNCAFNTAIQYAGPYNFYQSPPMLPYTVVDQGRILGGDDVYPNGKIWSVSPAGYEIISADPQLIRPRGVAVFPPATPGLSAGALVIRVDSPLNVLLIDSSGRRIGHDADGDAINDFGDSGAILELGPEGHPRVYALVDPPIGTFAVQAVGTGDGPYTIRSYLAETSTGGAMLARTGQAQVGVTEDLALHIASPLVHAWLQLGDLNCDGVINPSDLAPFVQALIDPIGYTAQSPSCELFNADMNRDSRVNGSDIALFMTKLIQG